MIARASHLIMKYRNIDLIDMSLVPFVETAILVTQARTEGNWPVKSARISFMAFQNWGILFHMSSRQPGSGSVDIGLFKPRDSHG